MFELNDRIHKSKTLLTFYEIGGHTSIFTVHKIQSTTVHQFK